MKKVSISAAILVNLLFGFGLQCCAETTYTTDAPTTYSTATETSVDSSSAPTTIGVTTTANYSCRSSLNTSPNLSPFWVTTVLSSVPSTEDVTACSWRDAMETRLLNLLVAARAQSSGRRRKRAAESGQLTLQLVSAFRSSIEFTKVSLAYYALLSGAYLPAASVAASLTGVSASAPSMLGYSVDSVAAAYETYTTPTSTNYLWLIGAIFGSLAAILLVIWTVLFAYRKCIQPYDHGYGGDKQRSLDSTTVDDFYTNGAMANVPDMRANPRLGFSKADIGTIADEVAKHLDSHMSDMVAGVDQSGRQQASATEAGESSEAGSAEINETIGSVRAEAAESGLGSHLHHSQREHPDGPVESTTAQSRRHQRKQQQKQKQGKKPKAERHLRAAAGDASAADGEATEQPEQRQQSNPAYASGSSKAEPHDNLDDGGGFLLTEWTNAPQDRGNSRLPGGSGANLPVSVTMDDALLTAANHPTAGLESIAAGSSSRNSETLASPYRTADQISRIRPLLEDDLKHQDLSRPRDSAEATVAAAATADGAAASSRVISVRPRAGGAGLASQSALPAGGGSQSDGFSRRRPVTQVQPVAPATAANQDEWDVVRQLARRPDSDTRALLGTLRREVAEFAVGSGDGGLTTAASATSTA